MFIVSKAFHRSSARVIVHPGVGYLVNPFVNVLFNVCSAVIVECCVFYPCCVGVFGMSALCKEVGSSPVSAITERRDMDLYEVPFSVSLLGFGIGTMLANFHV